MTTRFFSLTVPDDTGHTAVNSMPLRFPATGQQMTGSADAGAATGEIGLALSALATRVSPVNTTSSWTKSLITLRGESV
jgi:hypothetical protein